MPRHREDRPVNRRNGLVSPPRQADTLDGDAAMSVTTQAFTDFGGGMAVSG